MKLLIVTQVVDSEDPILGFFHGWLKEFAKHYEHVEVVCLKEGKHDLPDNVRVHSLGKEKGKQWSLVYALRFLWFAVKLSSRYDKVLVHMNQEYILLAGVLWKLLGKRIYLWRNHYAGSWLTDVAAFFCTNVFCTSKHSYTEKYEKTILMPVGIDASLFHSDDRIARVPRSILFLARIAPSKRPDMLIEALGTLHKEEVPFTASIVGSPLPQDEAYLDTLKKLVHEKGIRDQVTFIPAVANRQTPDLYRAHQIFVNCSRSGMFDKTLFEAAASGCTVLSSSADFSELTGPGYYFETQNELTQKLRIVLTQPTAKSENPFTAAHSLGALVNKLREYIQ